MSIAKIVEQALRDGYLTPAMEAEVYRMCANASEVLIEDYLALDRLMGALLIGDVVVIPLNLINVMEEFAIKGAIAQVAEIEATSENSLDAGDIAAYALNRLPPLYATTEEGVNFQRKTAQAQLQELISQQVSQAINRCLDRPNLFLERQALGKNTDNEIVRQVSALLQAYDNLLIQHFDELRSLISKGGVDRVCTQFVFFLLGIRQNKLD